MNLLALHRGSKTAVLLYLALRWPWLLMLAFGMMLAVRMLLVTKAMQRAW